MWLPVLAAAVGLRPVEPLVADRPAVVQLLGQVASGVWYVDALLRAKWCESRKHCPSLGSGWWHQPPRSLATPLPMVAVIRDPAHQVALTRNSHIVDCGSDVYGDATPTPTKCAVRQRGKGGEWKLNATTFAGVWADYVEGYAHLEQQGRLLLVRHEDLVVRPAQQLERILAFLGHRAADPVEEEWCEKVLQQSRLDPREDHTPRPRPACGGELPADVVHSLQYSCRGDTPEEVEVDALAAVAASGETYAPEQAAAKVEAAAASRVEDSPLPATEVVVHVCLGVCVLLGLCGPLFCQRAKKPPTWEKAKYREMG